MFQKPTPTAIRIPSRFLRAKIAANQLTNGGIIYDEGKTSWTRTAAGRIMLNTHLTVIGHRVDEPMNWRPPLPVQQNLSAYNGLYGYGGGSGSYGSAYRTESFK